MYVIHMESFRFKDRRWHTYSRYQSPLTRLLYHKLCMIFWYIKHTMYRHGYDSCGDDCRKQKHVSSVLLLLWLVRINGNDQNLKFQLRNDAWNNLEWAHSLAKQVKSKQHMSTTGRIWKYKHTIYRLFYITC